MAKVFLLGWDCVPPRLAFDELLPHMPNLQRLIKESFYGPLRSCRPPITIPAWMCMMTGQDPGQLGLYGFRHRIPGDYTKVWIPNSQSIAAPKVWELIDDGNPRIILLGVPPSYPPPRVNGISISGILTPDVTKVATYPDDFSKEIRETIPDYVTDITFRVPDKRMIMEDLIAMTSKRHELVKHLLSTKAWDFFAMVEIGTDRLHHAFWRYYDPEHHLHTDDIEFATAFVDYYRLLDTQLGEVLKLIPDDALFILVSDHGAKGMKGAFCINQWLYERGYLQLQEYPDAPVPPSKMKVDWAHTKAWAWGGYCASIFINMEGYEQDGLVKIEEYESFRDELVEEIKAITGPNGEPWMTMVEKPEEVYDETNGYSPDLLVYFDDLSWRAAGTIGHESIYLLENDTGPDDAVHDWNGIYVIRYPTKMGGGKESKDILDIAPTILHFAGVKQPHNMKGKAIGSE